MLERKQSVPRNLMLEKSQDLAHPLFSTPELVSEIVERVGNSRRTLFALALVSKVFSEPALDALWYKLRTLENLINLLPENARGEETCPDIADAYIFENRMASGFAALLLCIPTHNCL